MLTAASKGLRLALILTLFSLALPIGARELPKGVAWLWEFEAAVSTPPIRSGDTVLVVVGDKAMALKAGDGTRLWETRLAHEWNSDQSSIIHNGAWILPASGGTVTCLDIATGKERWSLDCAATSPKLCAGRLVVIDREQLYAVDPASGKTRWRMAGDQFRDMSVLGSRILYTTSDQIGLWDLANGKSLWREKTGETEKPILGRTVALSAGNDLVARDAATGRKLWKVAQCDSYNLVGDLVLARADYKVQAFSARSGKRIWSTSNYASKFVEAGPNLVAISDGYGFDLLNRRTGKTVVASSGYFPPLLEGNQLWAGCEGTVYHWDALTGKALPGLRNLFGPNDFSTDGPAGSAGKGYKLLPAGSALLALGEGAGTVHMASKPNLEISVDSPQTPGKIALTSQASFVRSQMLKVYKSDAQGTPKGEAVASQSWAGPAGFRARRDNRSVVLKEAGNYVVEVAAAGVKARQVITVTPIGLAVKLAPGQMLIQTLDVVRKVVLPGVNVQAGPEKGAPVMSGTTGPDGLLTLSTSEPLDQRLRLEIKRNSESFPFIITPEPFASTEKVFLQTDRPLYRSGHEVFFKGQAASGKLPTPAPLAGTPIKVEVRDSQDNPLLSQEMVTDSWGAFSGSLKLPAEPPLGGYRVTAQIGEGQLFSLPFEVQEYRKPPFEVAITTRTPLVLAGQPLLLDLSASYYFGGPVPGASVLVTVRRAELSGTPSPGHPGYQAYADFVSEQTITLGPDGKALIIVPTMPAMPDAEYLVNVEVTGPSGQVVEGASSALAQAAPYGVYLAASSWWANAGKTTAITVTTLDRLGKPHSGVAQLRVETWGRKGWTVVAKGEVRTGANGQGVFNWVPPKVGGGSYRVLARSNTPGLKGRDLDELSFWVSGEGGSSTAVAERKLQTEKTEYQVGQTAKLLFSSPQAGPALLTVEGQKLFFSRAFVARAGAQVLSFPIEAGHAPGLTVSVISVEKNGHITSNQVALQVPDTAHKLNLEINAGRAEYRPGQTATLQLTVTDAQGQAVDAQASLAVVDEALFALRPDQVPSLHGSFFGPRENRVQTFLMEPRRSQVAGFQTVPSPTKVRKDFKDTAYWQPNLLVTGGKAEVAVPLPDNLTRWRATTRVSTGDMKVGQGTTTLVSNLPLMVQAILPRFLVEGDRVDLLGLITNRTKSPVNVDVKLAATPGELERKEEHFDNLAPDGQGRAVSRQVVEENVLGKAPRPSHRQGQVEARSDGQPPESDAEQIEIPILPFGSPYAKGGSGFIKVGESKVVRVDSPRSLLKPKLEVRVAGSPLVAVEGALEYLADFPYGCVEQTMSRFLPTIIAAQAMNDLGVFSEDRKAKLQPMVEKGLSALYGYQHSDGGWGWWEHDETNPYLTGYVVSGLVMAQKAGYTVSEPVLRRGIDSALWQLNQLAAKKSEKAEEVAVEDTDTRIYLAWALSMAGQPPVEALQNLSGTPSKLSTYSVALLALVWQSSEQPQGAGPLVAELERRAKKAGIGVTWPAQALSAYGWMDDDVEATALAVRAVLASKPNSELGEEAVLWLLSQREGAQWKSTRDTAQAVLALLDFSAEQKAAPRTGTVDVRWDGQTLQQVRLQDKEIVVSIPTENLTAGAHNLELESNGSQAIYSYAETGFLREHEQVDLPGDSQGLRITRTYVVDQPGQLLRINRVISPEILNVPSGKEVEVEIEFELPSGMQYLKLEDPRPAGFEVIEGSLTGEMPVREEHRDALSAFFYTSLNAGKHSFTYRMRAETPGDYRCLPARVELMYRPAVFGTTPSQRVKVRRREDAP